jgi:hypothetical protein
MFLSFINHNWLSVARGSQGKTMWERRYVVLVRDRLNVYFYENGAASIGPEYGAKIPAHILYLIISLFDFAD